MSASGQAKDLVGTVTRLFTAQDIAKVVGGDALPDASDSEGGGAGDQDDGDDLRSGSESELE